MTCLCVHVCLCVCVHVCLCVCAWPGAGAETGAGLAAPGFLSWTTLAADWQQNLANGIDPFHLALPAAFV
jgi:hypothetical protein